MEKKSKQVLAAEERIRKQQEAKDTLRRETRGVTTKKMPPEFTVKQNLTYAAKQGVKKAQEVGKDVVEGVKNMKSKAGQVLETLQNSTAAKKAFEERKQAREAKKAKGGSIKKMAGGGSLPMVKKGGKMVPAFAADGVGKMSYGGKVKKMAYGGKAMKMADGKMVKKKKKTTKVVRRRGDGCAVRGKTKGRMV